MKAGSTLLAGWLLIALGLGRIDHALQPDNFTGLQVLSAHWVHLDLAHAYSNGLGWLLAVAALRRQLLTLVCLVLFACVAVSVGWLLADETAAYAGLSGVLYALAGFIAVVWLKAPGRRLAGISALSILGAALTGVGETSAFTVAAQAHYVGAATGVMAGVFSARRRFAGPVPRGAPAGAC